MEFITTDTDNEHSTPGHIGKLVRFDFLDRKRLIIDPAHKIQFDQWHKIYIGIDNNAGWALSIENLGGNLGEIREILKIDRIKE